MLGEGSCKVPGGKLVRVRVEYGTTIEGVTITGDFFLHPEEGIGALEESLQGMGVGAGEEAMAEALRRAAEAGGLVMVGITPEGIAKAVRGALRCAGG
ncbi:MAG: biotin--protein ligase [Euryarchaeota archaeon]|nr:biotin--protein ligase [Euryarchaeota archaeon]